MSENVCYTRLIESDAIDTSSLIDEVYYNDNTHELYIDLGDFIYRYDNVPARVVKEFEWADSAGAYYNDVIKPQYTAVNIGNWSTVQYRALDVGSKPIKNDIVEDAETSTYFSLKPFEESVAIEGDERDYAVVFEVDGLSDSRTYRLKSTSVDEAVQTVLGLGKMLDLTFIVREVVITFA